MNFTDFFCVIVMTQNVLIPPKSYTTYALSILAGTDYKDVVFNDICSKNQTTVNTFKKLHHNKVVS